jgi:hypothetical protein
MVNTLAKENLFSWEVAAISAADQAFIRRLPDFSHCSEARSEERTDR